MQMISKESQGYPLYVKGDVKIIERIKLVLYTTIALPKNIQISVPFIPKSKQITPLLQPMINLQIIDQSIRQQIMKGKYQLKSETLYVYYPCQFKVDEKVYRSLSKTYQNMVDQIPRNIKPFVHKLIFWQENSLQTQKHKINETLTQLAKQLIQAKLNSFVNEIKQYQSQPSTQKSLLHIFLLKNKLACLYSHLSLKNFAYDLYADVWNQMMVNFRCLMKFSSATKLGSNQKLQAPQDIPRSPYTFQNTNDILGYFQNTHSTAYLRIVTHSFMKFYTYGLGMGLVFQAVSKLKIFLDFILNNVLVLSRRNQWTKQQMKQFDVARNLWAIQVIFKCLKQLEQKSNTQTNKDNENDISKVHVSICSMLRNSIQRIGLVLYQFDNYSIFPGCTKKQLTLIFQKITKLRQPWRVYKKSIQSLGQQNVEQPVLKTSSLMRRQQFVLKVPQTNQNELRLKELISHKLTPPEQITKLLINFQAYCQVYLKVLQTMYVSLKNSPYVRVAKSLKMTVERATIMLGDWQDYQKVQDQPQQFTNFWPELHSIQKLYRLFFLFVKLLDYQLPQPQLINNQLVDVLKDQNLKQQQQKVFQIAHAILQTFQSHHINCNLATIEKLKLHKDLTIQIIIKGENISQLLNKAQNWNLVTQQTMLNQNKKSYNLKNIRTRQFKKCEKCAIQCINLCMLPSTKYTQIICAIQPENVKQQALFFIKQISLKIPTQENSLLLYIKVPKQIQRSLFEINIPKLQLTNDKNNYVFTQVWTPFVFKLSNFIEPVVINKVESVVINNLILQQQLLEIDSVKWLESNMGQNKKQQQISQFLLSDCFYVSNQQKSNNQVKNYHKFNEALSIQIKQSNEPYYFTFFIKSKKLQKIQRNSRKKIDQLQTHELISVSITLKSTTLNKQYKISSYSPTLCITPLLQLQYNIVQTCQQFSLTNLHQLPVKITEHPNQTQLQKQSSTQSPSIQENKNYLCQLDNSQSVCIQSRYITLSPSNYLHMKAHINLNDWFDAQSLLQQKCNTFRISYKIQHQYKIFKPIHIQTQIIGNINIPYIENSTQKGFQLIGKIEGQVKYTVDKFINMWLVPVRTGNIILPEIQINGKKGIWVNSLITNIQGL